MQNVLRHLFKDYLINIYAKVVTRVAGSLEAGRIA